MKFYFEAKLDSNEKSVCIENSLDVFSPNQHEIDNYVSTLGGFMEDSHSAVLPSSQALLNLTSKLLSL